MENRPVLLMGFDPEKAEIILDKLHDLTRVAVSGHGFAQASTLEPADNPPVVIVSIEADPRSAFVAVAELSEKGFKVVVVGKEKNADDILSALRAGAREFVEDGKILELREVVRTISAPISPGDRGLVTTLFPSKGGVGATTIAANLAGALQRAGHRTCLVDLDLHFGDVLSFLDLPGAYSISDLVANLSRLDRELLDSSATHHASGVTVLAQSDKIEEAESIQMTGLQAMFSFLRQHFEHIIVDGIRGFEDVSLAALDNSDRVFVVVTQDVPSVRNAQRCLEFFRELEYPERQLNVLLNRHQKRTRVSQQVIEEAIGAPVTATLANDFKSVIAAINRGVMLIDEAPRSRLTRDLEAVAGLAAVRQPRVHWTNPSRLSRERA